MYVSSMKGYHHFTGYLNYIKHHTEPDSLLPQIDVATTKQLSALLTSCFKTTHFKTNHL